MSDQRSVGQIIDDLGATFDRDDGDLYTDCIVLLKTVKDDGSVTVHDASGEATDWITKTGMLTVAIAALRAEYDEADDE